MCDVCDAGVGDGGGFVEVVGGGGLDVDEV